MVNNNNGPLNDTRNYLRESSYMFTPELQLSLDTGKLVSGVTDRVYMVLFRVLNYNSQTVVYNYISYPDIFFHTLVYFVFNRYLVLGNIHQEPGDFLCLVDAESIEGISYEDSTLFGEKVLDMEKKVDSLCNSYYPITLVDIYKLIYKLVLLTNGDNMCELFKLALIKDYKSFIEKVLRSVKNYKAIFENVDHNWSKESVSIINGCVFIVNDIDKLISNIREDNPKIVINQGPQSLRGRVNSMSNFLSSLDMSYRNSLYNHNYYHVRSGKIDNRFKLNRDKFTFNNIHMNIGDVRWYSISRSTSLSTFHDSDKERIKTKDGLLETCFGKIKDILKGYDTGTSLSVLQLEIENTLFNGYSVFSDKNIKRGVLYNEATYEHIIKSKDTIFSLLSNPDKFSGNTKTHGTEYIPWFRKILVELGSEKVSEMLIQYFLYVVTNQSITIEDIETPGIPSLMCYNDFGKRIVNTYIYSKYKPFKIKDETLTYTQFKNSNKEFKDITEDDNFYARVGGYFIYALIECDMLKLHLGSKSDDARKSMEYVRLTDKSRKVMVVNEKEKIFQLPAKLPMITLPKSYEFSVLNKRIEKLGGYLLNDIKYSENIFIKKLGYSKPSVIRDENSVIDLINGLSQTPYRINKETLNFIYQYGVDKGIIIDTNKDCIKDIYNNPYKSTSKKTNLQHISLVSNINLQNYILNIAELYSNIDEIYFPVRMDNRTRIYCSTHYFDYQKNDLAKGLISFAKAGKWSKTDTTIIKYFKAFGANMFGDGLDKKSINHRASWVDKNSDIILNFVNNDIVNKAENKTSFTSFCFEYKRFIEFMDDKESTTFYSYLPLQLDATCNGYQHLVLLTRENKLFDVLNLGSSSHDDDPNDFYTYILNLTSTYIKSQKNILTQKKIKSEKELSLLASYKKLLKVEFGRTMVKKTIMTKSYNASIPTQVSQLINNMTETVEGRNKYYIYNNNQDTKFKREDIVAFVLAIKYVVAKESPRVKELSIYLDGIVSICTKLNYPVPWTLPLSGVDILESYEKVESYQSKAFFFVNTRYTFKRYQRDVYDLKKQKRATMPNLIHSLDASTIAILYKNFKDKGSLYTIHDCFGVTANNVPGLILSLKVAYMSLYSSKGYLRKFDTFVKDSINKTFGDSVYNLNNDYVVIKSKKSTKKVPMPDINNVLKNSIDIDCIKESTNIIV